MLLGKLRVNEVVLQPGLSRGRDLKVSPVGSQEARRASRLGSLAAGPETWGGDLLGGLAPRRSSSSFLLVAARAVPSLPPPLLEPSKPFLNEVGFLGSVQLAGCSPSTFSRLANQS